MEQGSPVTPANTRRRREAAVLASLLLAIALLAAGAVVGLLSYSGTLAAALVGAGAITLAGAIFLARQIDVFRIVLKPTGGTRYEQLQRWTKVKVASVLLFLVIMVAGITLTIATLGRLGIVDPPGDGNEQVRLAWGLVLVLGGALAFAFYQSLRFPHGDRTPGMTALHGMGGLAAGATLALVGALLSEASFGFLRAGDAVFLLLAALLVLGLALFPTRGLPTPYRIFTHDPFHIRGAVHYTRGKGVMLPVLMAFGLLFILLLLFVVFGIGVVGAVDQLLGNLLALAVLGLLVVAIAGSFAASIYLARQEDAPVLFRRRRTREERRFLLILAISLATAAAFGVLAGLLSRGVSILGLAQSNWVDVLVVSILVALGPIGFYRAYRARRVRRMEDRFPDFLRDIASSHRGGLTLASAVHVAAKGDYGNLTPEVVKMSDQLSWNLSFEEVFQRFGETVSTPVVQRSVSLILEASRSGGATLDVLEAAARDAREIKTLENQRRLNMTLYVSVIYVTFLVFLGVVSVLYARFIPEIVAATATASSTGATGLAGLGPQAPSLLEYRTLYYIGAVVQAVGNGIIAGLMTTGRAIGGMRHAFVMVFIAFAAFSLFL